MRRALELSCYTADVLSQPTPYGKMFWPEVAQDFQSLVLSPSNGLSQLPDEWELGHF